MLLGKKGFVFSLNPVQMYETLFEYRDDDEEMQRRLAYWTLSQHAPAASATGPRQP